jgi:hypothetical protein
MVKAFVDLAKRSFAQPFDNFKSEGNMVSDFTNVFSILIIKAVVVDSLWRRT